jgi:ABC-type branched-subunit amino acid transport system substrate-binding protein
MSVVGLVSGGGAPAAASSYPSIPAGPIEIGLSAPLSGPLALDGKVISETDQIAANYVNNTLGGIDGHKIKLVTLDDQDNATVGVQVAEQLVTDKIAGVIGDGITPINLQEAPVFDKAHVPVVTFNSVTSASQYPYIFGDGASNAVIANVAAKLIIAKHLYPIGLVSDGNPETLGLFTSIISALKAQDPAAKVVANITMPPTSLDVTAQLSQLRSDGAKTIFFDFISQVEGPFFNGLRTLGWTPKLTGTDAMYYLGYNTIGTLGVGNYVICGTGSNIPLSSGVVQAILDDMKVEPGPSQVLDARENLANILVLRYAIQKTHTLYGPAVKSAIESMHDVSLGDPQWQYSFSSTQHNGYVSYQVCQMSPLGKYSSDVAIPASEWDTAK